MHLHQTSSARSAKGTALRRWRHRVRERGTQVQKEKMAMNKYISIANKCKWIKCSHQKTYSSWMDKKTWPAYMLSKRDSLQNKRPTQTESKGLETNIPSKGTGKKKSWGSNTYIRQNRFQNKCYKKRQRSSFHKSKEKNPPGSSKHCKHICTQHRSTRIYKENLGGLQGRYRQQHTYSRGC